LLTKRADRTVNDAGISGFHRIISHAQSIDRPRTKRFNEHIRRFAKGKELLAIARILEVNHDTLLAAVQIAEEDGARPVRKPDVAPGIALAGRFDLDDFGAVVCHGQRQVGSRQEDRQVNDADAFEFHETTRLEGRGLFRYSALSAPSCEQTVCSSRLPLILIGLASVRMSGFAG
jgi:hypothetical protein